MRRSNKHAGVQKTAFSPLTGGINVAVPPEQIGENQMQACQNFVYARDSYRLTGRGGLQKVSAFDSPIKGMYYDIDTNQTFIFLENRSAYALVLSSAETSRKCLDKVTGNLIPRCCKFKEKLCVASGGKLQFYDYGITADKLQTVTDAPVCDNLFYRWGRLMVTAAGSDTITYSSVGDISSDKAWEQNTNDPSSSRYIDIGSDDSGDIVEIVPLATDIVIFKSNGYAYQFCGDNSIDTWAVYTVSTLTDMTGDFAKGCSAVNVGNQVMFLSLSGLRSLATTQDYGNIAQNDIGDAFNKLITDSLYEPEMYHLRRHKTLIIRPTADRSFFVAFNYGVGAATTLKFAFDVAYILETKDDVFVGAGKYVYRWTPEAVNDDGKPIEYMLKPRVVLSSDEMLVKAIDTKFSSDRAGDVDFLIGERLKVTMPANSRKKIKCNHSTPAIDVTVKSNTRFEVDHIYLDMVDL